VRKKSKIEKQTSGTSFDAPIFVFLRKRRKPRRIFPRIERRDIIGAIFLAEALDLIPKLGIRAS